MPKVQCQNIQIFNLILGRVTWECGVIQSTNCTLSVFCFTEYNSSITQLYLRIIHLMKTLNN